MKKGELKFSQDQINRLFPFYFLLGKDLEIKEIGNSLNKLIHSHKKNFFQDVFKIKKPEVSEITRETIQSLCNQWVWLEMQNENKVLLRGQFEYFPNKEEWLFVGSPWLASMEELLKNELTINDFAFHDPQIDLLHVLKSQEIANDELKELIHTINQQKNDLRIAAEEINALSLFSKQNPDPLYRIQKNGRIILTNPAAELISEIYYDKKIYTAEEFWKYIAQEKNPGTHQWSLEIESDKRIFSFICVNIEDEHYFNVYGRDVTNRRRNQEEILRLSLVASANVSGVLFSHANAQIFWVNGGFTQLTGYKFHDVYGKTPVEVFKGPLTDREELRKMVDSFYNQEPFSVELIHYKKDGTWFWGRAKGQSYLTSDGETVQYFAIIEDITLEKQKEERLKILSQIAENITNGVVIFDTLGKISWVNREFTEMSGYPFEELLGLKADGILKGPETNAVELESMRESLRKGETCTIELIQYKKDGKPFLVKINGQATRDKKGDVTGYFALYEDITLERSTQTKLKESEARFRIALEKIGDEVWELDFRNEKSGLFLSENIPKERSRFFDKKYLMRRWSRVYEEDLVKLEQTFEKYISGAIDSHNIEYRIVNEENKIKWILDRGVVIERDEYGLPLRIIGTHTDISKIKKTETKLEQRVKQFKSLSENIPGVIYEFEFRPDGSEGLRYVSPAMERVFGIQPEDFYDYLKYLNPEDQKRITEKNQVSKMTLEPFYDESRLHVPGVGEKWHAIHSSFSYLSERNAKVFTGFMMDITERKNIENTLRSNEEKYRGIIDNMELGLLEMDIEGKITYSNQGFTNISGFKDQELIGKTIKDFVKNLDSQKTKTENPENPISAAYELKVKNKEGITKWWLASRAPRYNNENKIMGSIGIYLDITDQKKLEHELIEARVLAEQSAKSKEVFLANMSHEIRTPMNAIMGMSNQLTKTSLNSQQKFYLDTILSSAENLLVILNDILDISKIEAGKLSIEKIGFELDKVVQRSILVLIHKAEEKGIRLFNSYYDPRISQILLGDPYRINQVLLNLISNSVKFTEKGTVEILISLIKDKPESQILNIMVKDTGIGMDQDFVTHLFDKFSQEYESTTRKFGGTGLGMSICKQLVELMGGSILVESEKGLGTSCSMIIEFMKGTPGELPEKKNTAMDGSFLKGLKVLITDDNHLNRLVASITLENFETEIYEATNGKEALEFLEKTPVDIILMDIQMPVMNGLDCTKALRQRGLKTPVIALTAQAIKGEQDKCLQAGMNDYLSKPFQEDDLINMIHHWTQESSPVQIQPKPVPKEISSENLYDLSGLKAISRGNEAFIKKMVGIFLMETPPTVVEIEEAYKNQEWEKMGKLAHKIKPSIDNLHIHTLKSTIRTIESIGKENRTSPELPELIQELIQTIRLVSHKLNEEYPA